MLSLTGFPEAAALNVPEDGLNSLEDRERNGPYKEALKHLARSRNFANYHMYGDVWVPKDLRRGQVLRCNLPTDFSQTGNPNLNARNCLFLGFDVDPETFEPIAARLTRFSYNTEDTNTRYEPHFPRFGLETRQEVSGLKRDALLRTGSPIDIVPFSAMYWGHFVDITGNVSPKYMAYVEDFMAKGYESRRHIAVRNYAEMDLQDTLFVPSMDPSFFHEDFDFQLDEEIGTDLFELSDAEWDEIIPQMEIGQLHRSIERAGHVTGAKNTLTSIYGEAKAKEKGLRKVVADYMRQHNSLSDSGRRYIQSEVMKQLGARDVDLINSVVDKQDPLVANGSERTVADIPSFSVLMEQAHAKWLDETDPDKIAQAAVDNQRANEDSIENLANLGIGGLIREPSIGIPEHLWRGRYHMLRVPSLTDPSDMDAFTNRPAALWRAWVRPNQNAELEISHMELHPCTRDASHLFDYKMKVRPLDTKVKKPTHLIAEMSVIVEVNAVNFQPDQPQLGTFYELLPNQVRELEVRRQIAQENLGELKYFGMRPEDIPPDCIEVSLPEPPNQKVRQKLERWGNARFVGSMGGQRIHKTRKRFHNRSNHHLQPSN